MRMTTSSPRKSRSLASMKTLCYLCISATLLVVIFTLLSVAGVCYTIPLEDLLVNQGIMTVPDQPIFDRRPTTEQGRKLMAAHSVAIVGVGKDSADNLVGVLHQIEVLAGFFASSRAILIDGDSTDGSTKLLQDWTNASQSNRTLKVVKAPLLESSGPFAGRLLPREGRISQARNTALDLLATMPPTDYIIMLDLDIVGWNQMGVVDSFGRPSWDGICSNGVLLAGIFRDTYAFRQSGGAGKSTNHHLHGDDAINFNLTLASKPLLRQAVTTAKKQAQVLMSEVSKPVEVMSCFGGLAVYRSEAVGSCRYDHRHREGDEDGQHPAGMVECEHVLFSRCMARSNGARIFSNPNMKLWYGHSSFKALLQIDRVASSFTDFVFAR